jgi:DNA-binding IclR family transcriptional regulator
MAGRAESAMTLVQSIDRAFAVMEALAVTPAGITELAGRVELPKSTVARLLATLEQLGAVARTGDGRYRIGQALVELAGAADASASLASAVIPHLTNLVNQIAESAGFSVPTGYLVHYVAQVESSGAIQVRDYTGLQVPMHIGPSGLCMMSFWPTDDINRYLSRRLEAFTKHSVTDPKAIRQRLKQIRLEGHCWVYEEFAEGINSVASAVLNAEGKVMGAIHVHGPAYRFPGSDTDKISTAVKDAARQFSQRTNEPPRSRS